MKDYKHWETTWDNLWQYWTSLEFISSFTSSCLCWWIIHDRKRLLFHCSTQLLYANSNMHRGCVYQTTARYNDPIVQYVLFCSYELMQKCWSLDPDQRPTPIDIVASLTPLDTPAQDKLKEIVEEDCKTNGVKANGRHHLGEYYNFSETDCSFIFLLLHTFSNFLSCIVLWLPMTHSPPEEVRQGQKVQ